MTKEKASDNQIGGNHYGFAKTNPIDLIIELEMGFNEGNITKYITRYKHKNGIEDIRKIIHTCSFLRKQKKLIMKRRFIPIRACLLFRKQKKRLTKRNLNIVHKYCYDNDFDKYQWGVMIALSSNNISLKTRSTIIEKICNEYIVYLEKQKNK